MTAGDRWPPVLAGPIVRRAAVGEVAIWIALSAPARVTATVYRETTGAIAATGDADTVAIGARLHVALVRARGELAWGELYGYDLRAGDAPVTGPELAYPDAGMSRPGFALPPEDPTELRILHGSCRLPHGEGDDALAIADRIIAADPRDRPHHLLLTGDQIYVNNTAPELLPLLTRLGRELLGWDEPLPDGVGSCADHPAGSRGRLLRDRAGLLEYGLGSHLIGFGEIAALYCLTWSDALWPRELPDGPGGDRLRRFVATLPAVRRALANCPVLTIFDDHEVTDDWNLTLHWCRSVLGRPLGRRLVGNCLAAYAVFQGWGNDPDQFEDGPGRNLLDNLAGWRGDPETGRAIERLVGLPEVDVIERGDPPALIPPDGAVRWWYDYRGPRYRLLVPDQRTQRAFPGTSEVARPALLSDRAMDEQLAPAGDGAELLILVSSSALLPVPKPWYVRVVGWLSRLWTRLRPGRDARYADVYGPDRGDGWSRSGPSFDRLLAALARAAPGRLLALVGDIHVGSAARLRYRGERDLTLIQLTASPLHREHRGTRLAHRLGFGLLGRPRTTAVRGDRHRYRIDWLIADRRGAGSELVGVNQLAEVRLRRAGSDLIVDGRIWWRDGTGEPAPRTVFSASAEPGDDV